MGKSQLTVFVEKAAKGLMSPNEVTNEIFKKYNVTNKNQLEGFRKKIAREKRYEHIMEYHTVKDMYMQMNHAEVGAFYKLLLCLQWNKEGVLYKDGKPMKLKELRVVTGLCDRQLRKTLNRLEDLDLLIKSGAKKDQEYIVNPMYVNIGGTKASKTHYAVVGII